MSDNGEITLAKYEALVGGTKETFNEKEIRGLLDQRTAHNIDHVQRHRGLHRITPIKIPKLETEEEK